MDDAATASPSVDVAPPGSAGVKRKRSASTDRTTPAATTTAHAPPPSKAARTTADGSSSSHAHHPTAVINYLTRQYTDVLPLLAPEDSLPQLLRLLSDYAGVLDRHESLAGNLGARPLGPILVRRFERLFDGPPRVIKVYG